MSKIANVTGISFMARRTAASEPRCIRCWSSSKLGTPDSPKATTSPSSTTSSDPIDRPKARSSG